MKSPRPRVRARTLRSAGALAAAALLAGCSSDGGGDWLALLQAARSSWENRDAPVALGDAASIPYATLGVRIDGSREQILILALDTNGERLWTSAARIAISTRNGRIVRTAGFGADLSGFASQASPPEDWRQPHAYSWTGDFADIGYFAVPVNCDVRPAGADPTTILGQQLDTIRVDETCHADSLDWTYTNTYWVSVQSGRVWRSILHFHPKGPTVELEILRPPLSAG
ncbi:MAG TPA: YjbF family lipoprotein [Rhizomicrobium sp.]|jgi:hypothetical protein|nr:YjbF family lipoprotein [Rhizomicrobium sp.]